jgi:nitrous oxide reductase accessory protein NosL
MLKKLTPLIFIILLAIAIVVLFFSLASTKRFIVTQDGNLQRLPIAMKSGVYQDSDCGMLIDDLMDASQVIAKNGRSWFFHDHGGMVKWIEDKDFRDEAKIWVMSRDTQKWIDARAAFYSQTDKTPMGYGFGAYESSKDGLIGFNDMRLRVLRGETLRNPLIKKQLSQK